jgi:hypothetical protein
MRIFFGDLADDLKFIILHYWNRIICFFVGCDIHSYSDYNMPEDWTSPDYCKRCDACHDVYGYDTTSDELFYESLYVRILGE